MGHEYNEASKHVHASLVPKMQRTMRGVWSLLYLFLHESSPAPLDRIRMATCCRSCTRMRKTGESRCGEGPRIVPRNVPEGVHVISAFISTDAALAHSSSERSNSQETCSTTCQEFRRRQHGWCIKGRKDIFFVGLWVYKVRSRR